ncbi:MAG: TRAP transporter small permease [Syntrophorhabdaceae bacterium]|nr:TRAP transporter small permease [Syntrophorhabdaceae bacterium]
MTFFEKIGKFIEHINNAMVIVCGILAVGLAFIVGTDIALRYLFNRPLGWVKEVSEYILVGLGFLAAAWILKNEAHVKMDLLLTKVSIRTQTILNIATSVICTLVLILVTFFSFRVTFDLYKSGVVTPTVLEPPKWILMTPIILGFFLLTIQFVMRIYGYIERWKKMK